MRAGVGRKGSRVEHLMQTELDGAAGEINTRPLKILA
jgi:hypothetical protein